MNKTMQALCLLVVLSLFGRGLSAQKGDRPLQVDVAAGLRTYHLPGFQADWNPTEPVIFAGVSQPFNYRQTLGMSLRLGYARGRYQGDALEAQLLFQVTPVIARHLEIGLGLGAGYRWSFYPSEPLALKEGQWTRGRAGKGVFQAPLQLSLGYRSLRSGGYEWRPYLAYQIQALFGYSPDLSPLPVSNALIGVKFSPVNNHPK